MVTRRAPSVVAFACLVLASLAGCQRGDEHPKGTEEHPEKKQQAAKGEQAAPPPAATAPEGQAAYGTTAVAQLAALGGSGVGGTVTFTVVDPSVVMTEAVKPMAGDPAAMATKRIGVRVRVEVTGLSPGQHGLHVHEWGDCSAPDGNSAGGHFNPHGMPHGDRTSAQRHPGDFGNVEADATGRTTLDLCCFDFPLAAGADGLLGRSVIVHAQPDDLTTQPTGNSGARVACGVIQLTTGETQPVLAPAAAGQ
jgi:Cu-Zn family superoxide dismutase